MKKVLFTSVLVIGSYLSAQTVSTLRIGDVKLNMTLAELKTKIKKDIDVPKNKDGYPDEINVIYEGVLYSIQMVDYNSEQGEYTVYSVSSVDPRLKTVSGLGIGSTLDQLLSMYKNFNINLYDYYDENGTSNKENRIFSIEDWDAGSMLMFQLKKGVVTKITVTYNEGC